MKRIHIIESDTSDEEITPVKNNAWNGELNVIFQRTSIENFHTICVDESLIKFKGTIWATMYNLNKQMEWGIRNYGLHRFKFWISLQYSAISQYYFLYAYKKGIAP